MSRFNSNPSPESERYQSIFKGTEVVAVYPVINLYDWQKEDWGLEDFDPPESDYFSKRPLRANRSLGNSALTAVEILDAKIEELHNIPDQAYDISSVVENLQEIPEELDHKID